MLWYFTLLLPYWLNLYGIASIDVLRLAVRLGKLMVTLTKRSSNCHAVIERDLRLRESVNSKLSLCAPTVKAFWHCLLSTSTSATCVTCQPLLKKIHYRYSPCGSRQQYVGVVRPIVFQHFKFYFITILCEEEGG